MAQHNRQSVLFEGLFSEPVVAAFDGEAQSSDGGLLLLGAIDRRIGLTEALGACIPDERDAARVEHTHLDLLRQRVFSIAAGYEDANDAARTACDPVLKEACGRRALEGRSLGSQPTLSRFERSHSGRAIVALGRRLETFVIARHRRRLGKWVRLVTIELDPTHDPTHGQQAFAFFNGHYDCSCYLPPLGFLSFDDEPEQYLFSARLRPGTAYCPRTAIPLLRRTILEVRRKFPRARIRVRLDGGFACPAILDLLDEIADEYVVNMPSNARLLAAAEPLMVWARQYSEILGETAHLFGEVRYAAESWSRERRVIIKAEVVRSPGHEPKDNPRFVVAKLPRHASESAYGVHCGRGDIENRIKELKDGVKIDRTSTSEFLANQFRVLLAATAYVMFQELRLAARPIAEFAKAQVITLRERLLKIGARVVESVRRIALHFPTAYPWAGSWRMLVRALGAT